jgi:putative ABC transport system permease protein
MNRVLRFALLLCPREFRDEYADEIVRDADEGNPLYVAFDAVVAGITMRAENALLAVRSAMRALLRTPLSAAVCVLSIALAVGASVAVASVLEGVLFHSLPYAQANRLVFFSQHVKDFSVVGPSYPEAERIARETRTLSGIAIENGKSATLLGHGVPEELDGRIVSVPYFRVLGVVPKIGRPFAASDLHSNVVLISERLWLKDFHGEASVLGAPIRLKDFGAAPKTYTVIGVVPEPFRDPTRFGVRQSDFWMVAQPGTAQTRAGHYYDAAIARLAPGETLEAARADMARVIPSLAHEAPVLFGRIEQPNVAPVLQTIVGPVEPLLWVLYAAVTAVLLIACANVLSLNFTRLIVRESELAIRSALGATRARLAGQVAVEAAILAVAGGALGIGLGFGALRAFGSYGEAFLPRWSNVRIDGAVLLYTVALMVFVTIVTGVLPALLRLGRGPAREVPAGRSPAESRSIKRACATFVVIEAALCIAVSICAGVVLRSYVTLTHADIGFNPGPHAYNVQFYPLPAGKAKDVVQQVRALPEVTAVTASDDVPFANFTMNFTSVDVVGEPRAPKPMLEMIDTDGTYLGVMRIPLLRGRTFSASDRMSSKPVALVSASFARDIMHDPDPIGKQIVPQTYAGSHAVTRTIVGVVGGVRDSRAQPAQPQIYVPLDQIGDPTQLVLRTNGSDEHLAAEIDRIFRRAAPENPPPLLVTFDSLFAQDAAAARGNTALFGGLALIALILALAGTYAVASYSTQRRTHEFGIRKAVGASNPAVVLDALRATLRHLSIGVCAGLVIAAFGVRFLSGILYQTTPFDPLTFVAITLLFGACAALATVGPAVRTTRVDPATALRYE